MQHHHLHSATVDVKFKIRGEAGKKACELAFALARSELVSEIESTPWMTAVTHPSLLSSELILFN